ncbi:putative FBD-associated F-box protein At3g50710 [Trifolium pratense]|uniref:putative FBD-associated F-box protein At3g50710 n=1 Tax=Trifolium pratense TaxID=57577 RepID=UPI001E695D01|nr:putative FBD-associated F-box protein At3g50710 [Trifolium pratense]
MENSTPIDRISNLPDELLCHILSFLPTKVAFTTTVLSKRWTPLFKLLTTLHFHYESVAWITLSDITFSSFVDKVIFSTKLIKTFHLNCHSKHSYRFNHWIKAAKQHPLENLELCSTFHYLMITLRPSNFIFPKLVVLKLTSLKVDDFISVDLPSLKTLRLIYVNFTTKDNFNKLLNGCPILEDLETRDIYCSEQRDGAGRVKTLSNLTRANISTCYVPIKAIPNVQVLHLQGLHLDREIKSFYRDFLVLQNLIHLELRFNNIHHWNDDVMKVLKNCSKLQILTITKLFDLYNQTLDRIWKNPKSIPKSCTLNLDGIIDGSQFATYILKNAPLLRVMKINAIAEPRSNQDALKELESCPRISTECELSISFTEYEFWR